ncbi:hypothetical protein BKA58DRAFT_461727 [Alternaria rosae]|uniref:uncharacterized protein n=1 Tax=Alternaria rosae TaxID=1187941 RepID=UPI001E8DEBC7|nr:uncharacterized protein BKA58DRAFT_461727 [Alternaria rosae]KAH6865739.1 hypothetical protein BKA58DRAFT_461727 [Alternaria rosae]
MPGWVVSTQDVYDTSGFLNVSMNTTEVFSSTVRDQYRFDPSDVVVLRNGSTVLRYRNGSTSDCFAAYGTHGTQKWAHEVRNEEMEMGQSAEHHAVVADVLCTGFATVNGNNLLDFGTSLIPGVLLANTPQLVLSYLYIALNALYTNMFVSAEWASYVKTRKPLCVTSPTGFQRDSYWLNAPFRYAIPITIMPGLFHWLASQSISKVQVSITDLHTRKAVNEISTCGYYPVAIILTTVVGFTIVAGAFVISRFWCLAGIPLASSCPAAISAACHALSEDVNASLLPVQWDAVTHGKAGEDGEEPIGHCCFTSFPVEMPIPGRLYA